MRLFGFTSLNTIDCLTRVSGAILGTRGARGAILSIFLNGSRTGYGIGYGNASVSLLPFVPSLLASCVWLTYS